MLKALKYHLHILEAMAFSRDKAMDFINSIQDEIIEHIIKIAIYDGKDRQTLITHWENEILEWLAQIDRKSNKLKKQRALKLKDYILLLNDDLPRAYTVIGHIRVVKRKLAPNTKWRELEPQYLLDTLYALMEAQYQAMSQQQWDEDTLLNHELYKELAKC